MSLGVKYWFEVATNPSPVLLPDLVVMKKNGATLDTVASKQGQIIVDVPLVIT